VRWDEDVLSDTLERVSPWEIEPSISLPGLSSPSVPRLKKARTNMPPNSSSNPLAVGGESLDFDESVRYSKVLQGQEKVDLRLPPCGGGSEMNHPLDFQMHRSLHRTLATPGSMETKVCNPSQVEQNTCTGFSDSTRSQQVLQGQEIFNLKSLHRGSDSSEFNHTPWNKNDLGFNMFNMYQRPSPNFYALAANDVGNIYMTYNNKYNMNSDPMVQPLTSDFQRENIHSIISSTQRSTPGITRDHLCNPSANILVKEQKSTESLSAPATDANNYKDEETNAVKPSCKLFGISLTADISIPNSQSSSKRSCTKVHKQGNLVGRAVDLSKMNGYDDFLSELERLFNMEGLLRNPDKGWQVVYTDSDNDMVVVGDDPWHEFCDIVSKIHIYTQEEVEKMTTGMISDDTQSCLEEAPALMDVSKSCSEGHPDSSPTVLKI
ncbi:Auxin response factor, partial [Thalictrum thalictroides]